MIVSTKGRYALRVMIDLAQNGKNEFLSMKEVSERQQISLKYLERIMPLLVSAQMLEGEKGRNGGYRLTKKTSEYRISDILKLTEGTLAPVACLECDDFVCKRSNYCPTLPMWKNLQTIINNYFDKITLADLVKSQR